VAFAWVIEGAVRHTTVLTLVTLHACGFVRSSGLSGRKLSARRLCSSRHRIRVPRVCALRLLITSVLRRSSSARMRVHPFSRHAMPSKV
jgi:hypothetical protein